MPRRAVLVSVLLALATNSACSSRSSAGSACDGPEPKLGIWQSIGSPTVSSINAPHVTNFCSPNGPRVSPGRGPDPGPRAIASGGLFKGTNTMVSPSQKPRIRYIAQNWTGSQVYYSSWAAASDGAQPVAQEWLRSQLAGSHVGDFDEIIGDPAALGIKASGCIVIVVQIVAIA